MPLLAVACLGATCLFAQSTAAAEPVGEWILRDIPQTGSSAWRAAATADWSWDLSSGSGALALRAIKTPDSVRLGVSGGMLLGSAKGLVLIPATATADASQVSLCTEPISALYRHTSGIYALSSSPPGQSAGGKLWLVQSRAGIWKASWILDLRESGWAITGAANRQLWVVTQSRLYQVDLVAKKITTIIDNAFWNGLRPVSMVSRQGLLHIGMRGGVVSIDPENRVMAWTQRLAP